MTVSELIEKAASSTAFIEVSGTKQVGLADVLPLLEHDTTSQLVTLALHAYLEGRYHDVLRALSQQSDLHASLLKQLALLQLIDSPNISQELRRRVFLQLQDCIKDDKTGKLEQQVGLLGSALGYR